MNEASTIAGWLRQREGETDAAGIARVGTLFQPDATQGNDEKTDRIGDRVSKRFLARQEARRDEK